jgi:hypothetical protein
MDKGACIIESMLTGDIHQLNEVLADIAYQTGCEYPAASLCEGATTTFILLARVDLFIRDADLLTSITDAMDRTRIIEAFRAGRAWALIEYEKTKTGGQSNG